MVYRSKAPLRLGLAGGGTDVPPYCDEFGGVVLNATIDMYAYCTIEPTDDDRITIYSVDQNQFDVYGAVPVLETGTTLLLQKGVYNRVVHDFNDGRPLSFKMTTYSDAPVGSGLGSSSTMVVAILKAFIEWLNLPLGEYDAARLAYQIERVDLGLSGGKQDQYAATFGGFNFIEFGADDRVIVNPLRIKNWIRNELESSLLLYYTGTSRESARIIDDQVKNTKMRDLGSLEGMHALKASAYRTKECILKGDFSELARCFQQGWEAKKKTSSAISSPKIEEVYRFIMEHGGTAAKISGAGGGGFMMILCDPTRRYGLMQALHRLGGFATRVSFTDRGTQGWWLANGGM